jgi:hypothetical protein
MTSSAAVVREKRADDPNALESVVQQLSQQIAQQAAQIAALQAKTGE